MTKNFRELRAKMSKKARAASAEEHRRLIEEMSLYQLRKARELKISAFAEDRERAWENAAQFRLAHIEPARDAVERANLLSAVLLKSRRTKQSLPQNASGRDCSEGITNR